MLWLALLIISIGIIGYLRLRLEHATWVLGAWLVIVAISGSLHSSSWFLWLVWLIVIAILSIINLPNIRQKLISKPAMKLLSANLPTISRTEQEALDGGNVWWDAQLFSGKPDWSHLRDISTSRLTEEEQAFLDGPVNQLCSMLDDWQITHELQDLPKKRSSFI